MIFPTYIASKGRAMDCKTAKLLEGSVPFTLVIEPQEVAAYSRAFPGCELLPLPGNDRGLPFARNFILDHARSRGLEWFWMLDDDLSRFYVARDGKCHRSSAGDVLRAASERTAELPDVAQVGLEYQQFAWSATSDLARNSYCDVAVAIHAERCKRLRFREDVTLKLDRDFTLQVLASGWGTARFSRLAFSCPKNGSNAGGLAPLYATGGYEEAASLRMVELWGDRVCRFHRKSDGRPDVSINWRFFRSPVA